MENSNFASPDLFVLPELKKHRSAYDEYKKNNCKHNMLPILDKAKHLLKSQKIECLKYNYSFGDTIQNFNHYECLIKIENDHLIVINKKPQLSANKITERQSNASCHVNEIKSFIYGAFSSRFWLLRKQINSTPLFQFKKGKVPFYAWQCITIETKYRMLDLVIKNDEHMVNLLVYLVHNL